MSSFIVGGIVVFLLLQQSILSSAASRHHSENICNDIPSVLNALGIDNDSDILLQQQPSKVLSDNDHNELLLGYDLLTDIFSAQSRLWLVPILRKLARGTPLVIESTDLIHKLVTSGKHHKKQLLSKKNGLRNLQPNESRHFIDTNPSNKLTDQMGKNIAWNIMSDLSARGDEFDFHFALVHMASFRIIHSVSLALLGFETNVKRREWLKSVAEEYNDLRIELRNTIMEYIRCEKDI